ncbi:MAG TPA: hypothetical protein EYQ00_04580 [Dehalococcoidia bacterium]|nr:hypothetical protein [Dehalococcoidia bacterium]
MNRNELTEGLRNRIGDYWKVSAIAITSQTALVITILATDIEPEKRLLVSVAIVVAALFQIIAGDPAIKGSMMIGSDLLDLDDEEMKNTSTYADLKATPWAMFRATNLILPVVVAVVAIVTVY